jgi:hypothetical protein
MAIMGSGRRRTVDASGHRPGGPPCCMRVDYPARVERADPSARGLARPNPWIRLASRCRSGKLRAGIVKCQSDALISKPPGGAGFGAGGSV